MKRGVILFVFVMMVFKTGFSQESKISQAQTLFIYNFSRMVAWPSTCLAGDFVIGVVGNDEIFNELVAFVSNKKVGPQSIIVKKFDAPQKISQCHIVFIGDEKISLLNEIIRKLEGSNSLIITEKKGMIHAGSAIDFFIEKDKLMFMVNSSNAKKYNLHVSKALEDLAYKN